MTEILVIDGYNILHAWDELKRTMAEDLSHAREQLIQIMGNYQAVKGIKVIIVFDAHQVKGGAGFRDNAAGVEVIYTAEGETADMLIEKLVGQLAQHSRVTVATSDWAQQRIVFGQGAVRLSARELALEVTDTKIVSEEYYRDSKAPDRKLHVYLNGKVRETLERIRRQK